MKQINTRNSVLGALICFLALIPAKTVIAQSWEELTSGNDTQLKLAIASDTVQVFERPSLEAAVSRTLLPNEGIWIYDTWRHFYAVAKSGEGHVGYVARDRLRKESTSLPQNQKVRAEDMRRRQDPAKVVVQNLALKDPGLGTLFSVIITGGGQLYAGRTGKGVLLMLVGVAAPAMGYGFTAESAGATCDGYYCTDHTNYAPLYMGAAVGFSAWFIGVVTADDDVREYNDQVRSRNSVTTAPVVLEGRPALAVRVRW